MDCRLPRSLFCIYWLRLFGVELKKISEMTREEINEELKEHQRRVIENFDDHTAKHRLVQARTQDFITQQVEDIHIDGEGTGDLQGSLKPPQDGQYL